MRLFLSGPMRGIERYNYALFDRVAEQLRHKKYAVVSPPEVDRANGVGVDSLPDNWDWNKMPPGWEYERLIQCSLKAMEPCEAIVMLPGWRQSNGARLELQEAIRSKMSVYLYDQCAPGLLTEMEVVDYPKFRSEAMEMGERCEAAVSILDEAKRLTTGDRQSDYGHPLENFQAIADYWSLLLQRKLAEPITAEEVGMMNVLSKVARHSHRAKLDNIVDIAGYAHCLQMISDRRKANGTEA